MLIFSFRSEDIEHYLNIYCINEQLSGKPSWIANIVDVVIIQKLEESIYIICSRFNNAKKKHI